MSLTLNSLTMSDVQVAIDALETDVAALQVEDLLLQRNIRTYVVIDMNNDDYTMTDDEANSAVIAVTNSGDGSKTLTWPTTSDTTRPAQQLVITIFTANGFIAAAQTGGSTADLVGGTIHYVTVPDGIGAFNVDEYVQTEARKVSNGITVLDAGDTAFNDDSAGKLQHAADGSAQTLTIAAGNTLSNLTAPVYCSGAGGLTVQGAMGVTVSGNAVLATGDRCTIYRDALTETYLCV